MSFNIYPVTQSDERYDGYRIFINGREYPCDCARVSKIPFNRRWPGYQRKPSQSELINFISLETDEPLEFKIITKDPFEEVLSLPQNSITNIKKEDEYTISFTLPGSGYYSVEPFGRRNPLLIFADKPEKNDYKNQKNLIYFPAGIHNAGTIELDDDQTLYIDKGAVVYANVHAKNKKNITIAGRGILDNAKNKEVIHFEVAASKEHKDVGNASRTHTVHIEFCDNVKIEGITIRHSLVYNIKPVGCKDLDIRDVKILGCWRYNSDGIDMHNCENVEITNCFIRTFDDCICVKGFDPWMNRDELNFNGKDYDFFKNVRVSDCVLWNDWGKCLEIGAETRSKVIENIVFENCKIIHVTHTPLDIMNVDYAHVKDVVFQNISVYFDKVIPQPLYQESEEMPYEQKDLNYSPTLINAHVVFHHEYSAGEQRRGKIDNVVFKNIDVTGDQDIKLKFAGYDTEHQCKDITVSNISRNGKKLGENDVIITKGEYTSNISFD